MGVCGGGGSCGKCCLSVIKKTESGLHPSAGLCVFDELLAGSGGHVFPSLVANIPFTVFDSTSLCDFSGKKKKNAREIKAPIS